MNQEAKKSGKNLQYIQYNPQMVNNYNALFEQKNNVDTKREKAENFKQRLSEFKKIKTLEEAKILMDKIMPVRLERTVFFVGDAKCTIINKNNLLRICYDSPTEFISYNFV